MSWWKREESKEMTNNPLVDEDTSETKDDSIFKFLKEIHANVLEMKKDIKTIEHRVVTLESTFRGYKRDELSELKKEVEHRSRYIEQVFENLLEKDFTKSATNGHNRMYRSNGKIAGPVGRLP